jgi:hypothetical protein
MERLQRLGEFLQPALGWDGGESLPPKFGLCVVGLGSLRITLLSVGTALCCAGIAVSGGDASEGSVVIPPGEGAWELLGLQPEEIDFPREGVGLRSELASFQMSAEVKELGPPWYSIRLEFSLTPRTGVELTPVGKPGFVDFSLNGRTFAMFKLLPTSTGVTYETYSLFAGVSRGEANPDGPSKFENFLQRESVLGTGSRSLAISADAAAAMMLESVVVRRAALNASGVGPPAVNIAASVGGASKDGDSAMRLNIQLQGLPLPYVDLSVACPEHATCDLSSVPTRVVDPPRSWRVEFPIRSAEPIWSIDVSIAAPGLTHSESVVLKSDGRSRQGQHTGLLGGLLGFVSAATLLGWAASSRVGRRAEPRLIDR